MDGESVPVIWGAAPGWYGKLPGMGDFGHRRLPDDFRDAWARWLHGGLARLHALHQDWSERYRQAPLWCFVLGDGVIDGQSWIGVMMPSLDTAGRPYPFTVTQALESPRSELKGDALAHVRRWWTLAIEGAGEGLRRDLDAIGFEVLLHRLYAPAPDDGGRNGQSALALPVVGQTLWFTDPTAQGGLGMASQGLPQDDQFEALFGYAAGAAPPNPDPP